MKHNELNTNIGLMCEMANLYPRRTGIEYVMWFGEVGGQHGPRIKVSNVKGKFALNDNFVISVNKVPTITAGKPKISKKELIQIIAWIKKNYNDLMLMWEIHENGDDIQLSDNNFLSVEDILIRLQKI